MRVGDLRYCYVSTAPGTGGSGEGATFRGVSGIHSGAGAEGQRGLHRSWGFTAIVSFLHCDRWLEDDGQIHALEAHHLASENLPSSHDRNWSERIPRLRTPISIRDHRAARQARERCASSPGAFAGLSRPSLPVPLEWQHPIASPRLGSDLLLRTLLPNVSGIQALGQHVPLRSIRHCLREC